MRHRIAGKKLSRDRDHRKMLLRNLAAALVTHEKVETTLAKAKFVQPYAEIAITKAIKANRSQDKMVRFNTIKMLKTDLASGDAVKKLLNDVAGRFENTKGGYTRIVKIGNRDGDNAPLARIELSIKAKPAKEKGKEIENSTKKSVKPGKQVKEDKEPSKKNEKIKDEPEQEKEEKE